MTDTDEAEVTLRLTASERRAVVNALRFVDQEFDRKMTRIQGVKNSVASMAADVFRAEQRHIRRVLARITEDGE